MPVLIYLLTFFYDPLDSAFKYGAFTFLVMGSILISYTPAQPAAKKTNTGIWLALGASFSFAVFFVLNQYIFRNYGFINGMVWPRLGTALSLVYLLSKADVRHQMATILKPLSFRLQSVWIVSQGLAAIGFLGQSYVISIPGVRVAMVSALQSVQYAFILVLATALSAFKPELLREHVSRVIIMLKLGSLICIGIGLYLVSL